MAIAATFDQESPRKTMNSLFVTGYFTLSDSYSTGGESLATIIPGDAVGTRTKAQQIQTNNKSGYQAVYDQANNKLLIMEGANAELGAGAYPPELTTTNPIFFIAICKFN